MFNRRRRNRGRVFVVLAACAMILAGANPEVGYARPLLATSPSLGVAANYAILAGQSVSNVAGATVIIGNIGISPGAALPPNITGFPPGIVVIPPFSTQDANATALAAQGASNAAYTALNAGANADANCIAPYVFGAGVVDLVGANLVPGVYCADAFTLSGTLTLSGSGVWVFKSAATLITSGTANVVGSDPCSVWWRVPSSATLGTNTSLIGNILADTSITMNSGANLNGRAHARTGSVTLNTNRVNVTVCAGVTSAVTVSKSFSPATITAGGVSLLTITFSNVYGTATTLTSSFTDNLPAGMVIAGTPSVATTCGGAGALTANPGGSAVTMASGRTIPGSSSCTLTVNVTTPLTGSYIDTVPSGALVSTYSNSTTSASATLTTIANAAATVAAQAAAAQPREVPEADTLLLFGGGIGGLATWMGWQWRKVRRRSKQ